MHLWHSLSCMSFSPPTSLHRKKLSDHLIHHTLLFLQKRIKSIALCCVMLLPSKRSFQSLILSNSICNLQKNSTFHCIWHSVFLSRCWRKWRMAHGIMNSFRLTIISVLMLYPYALQYICFYTCGKLIILTNAVCYEPPEAPSLAKVF